MKWEEFVDTRNPKGVQLAERKTDIECPQCNEYIFEDRSIILASYPPKLHYFCKRCGWRGIA